jgi:hypothetical protein
MHAAETLSNLHEVSVQVWTKCLERELLLRADHNSKRKPWPRHAENIYLRFSSEQQFKSCNRVRSELHERYICVSTYHAIDR